MGDRFFLALLVALFWLGIAVAACGGAVLARWVPEPAKPAPTLRLLVNKDTGGACYALGDQLGPCFEWPKETP